MIKFAVVDLVEKSEAVLLKTDQKIQEEIKQLNLVAKDATSMEVLEI